MATTTPPPTAHPAPAGLACSAAPAGPTAPSRLTTTVVPLSVMVVLIAALARLAARPLANPDTFFHLRFGEEFLSGWSLRHPGSPTTAGTAHWLPTQWLAQVVMAELERIGGLPAVAWFAGLQYVALALTVFLLGRRWSDPVVAAPLTVWVVTVSATGLSMRPQVFSYLAAALVSAAWVAARRSGRTPWWLVPFTWLWACYHGMWPIGIVIGLVACLGLRLDGLHRGAALRRALAVPVLSAVAAALTPVGPGLYGAVLEVGSRSQYFSEWAAPRFTTVHPALLLLLLAVTVAPMLRGGPISWGDLLLLALAGALAVYSARTVPVAAAVLLPLTATRLQALVGRAHRRPTRGELTVVVGAAVAALAVLAAVVPSTSARPASQPSWVTPSLDALPAGTRIVGDDVYGGILMWQQPDLDVVLSGYGDVYTDAEMERNRTIGEAGEGWVGDLKRLDVSTALVSTRSALAYNLRLQGWRVAHHSPEVELLVAPPGW